MATGAGGGGIGVVAGGNGCAALEGAMIEAVGVEDVEAQLGEGRARGGGQQGKRVVVRGSVGALSVMSYRRGATRLI